MSSLHEAIRELVVIQRDLAESLRVEAAASARWKRASRDHDGAINTRWVAEQQLERTQRILALIVERDGIREEVVARLTAEAAAHLAAAEAGEK